MPRCCVSGCDSGSFKEVSRTKAAGKRVKSFFTFPKNEELQRKWKQIIYNNEDEVVVKPKICEVHFKESDIIRFDDTILKDGTIHRMHRQRFLLRKGAIPILSNDEKLLSDAMMDDNLTNDDDDDDDHNNQEENPIIVIQDQFMSKLGKNVENGMSMIQNQKETVIVDLTNQPEMYQNNLNLGLDSDVEIYSVKDLFQIHDMDEVNVEGERLILPDLQNDYIASNKQEKKMNINLNSIIQEACETEKNNSNVIYHRDTRKRKYQNYFDSGNQHDYLLTGDIPNYDTEMVKFQVRTNDSIENTDVAQQSDYNQVAEESLVYDFIQLKNDLQNKSLNISSSWAYTFNQDNTVVTFTYVHPIKLLIHLYCIVDSNMTIKISPFDRKVSQEMDIKFKTSSEFSDYLSKLETTKCCEGTGIRNTYSKRCQGFISVNDEYKRSRGYQRCNFCREFRKKTLNREDNFFNFELRMREQNCKIRTLQYKYSQLQKFLIKKGKICSGKQISN